MSQIERIQEIIDDYNHFSFGTLQDAQDTIDAIDAILHEAEQEYQS